MLDQGAAQRPEGLFWLLRAGRDDPCAEPPPKGQVRLCSSFTAFPFPPLGVCRGSEVCQERRSQLRINHSPAFAVPEVAGVGTALLAGTEPCAGLGAAAAGLKALGCRGHSLELSPAHQYIEYLLIWISGIRGRPGDSHSSLGRAQGLGGNQEKRPKREKIPEIAPCLPSEGTLSHVLSSASSASHPQSPPPPKRGARFMAGGDVFRLKAVQLC